MFSKNNSSNKLRKFRLGISVATLTFAFCFLIPEIVIRTFNLPWKKAVDELSHFEYNPPLAVHNHKIDTFRPININYLKSPNTYRILVLGDSFAWGDKIRDYKDTWPEVLQKELRQSPSPKKYEVLNLGGCGFTTVDELGILQKIGWNFNPDLILLQFTLNDPLPRGRKEDQWLFPTKNLVPIASVNSWLKTHSYFFHFLDYQFCQLQIHLFYSHKMDSLYEDNFYGWKECQQALQEIAASAAKKEVKTVCIVMPLFVPGKHTPQNYPYQEIHRKIASKAKEQGFYTLDLLDPFIAQGKDFREWHALKLDRHPNQEAHRLSALWIKDYLKDEKLIHGED